MRFEVTSVWMKMAVIGIVTTIALICRARPSNVLYDKDLQNGVALNSEAEVDAQRVSTESDRLRSSSNSSRRRAIQLFEDLEQGFQGIQARLSSNSAQSAAERRNGIETCDPPMDSKATDISLSTTSRRSKIEMLEKLSERLSELLEHPLTIPIFWGVFIYCLVSYMIAYVCTMNGWMVTYSGWGDFIMSSLWLMLIPAGLLLLYFEENDSLSFIGVMLVVVGSVSAIWLLVFAVINNRHNVLLSIVAIGTRIVVSVLIIVVLSRLKDKWDEYERGERGVVRGLTIPLLVVTMIYRIFVRPLIDRRE